MKQNVDDNLEAHMDGHVLIRYIDTGEVLLDKHNAINFYNMSIALANLMANKTDDDGKRFHIAKLAMGNGGTVIDGSGNVFYKAPNVSNVSDTLYAETYSKAVTTPSTGMTTEAVDHVSYVYSDITVTTVLAYAEPDGTHPDYPDQEPQNLIDNDTGAGDYVFDEIALVTESGSYLTHLIFHPIEKAANRELEIIYTIRVRAGS